MQTTAKLPDGVTMTGTRKHDDGTYSAYFEGPGGFWTGIYLPDGRCLENIWETENRVPWIDPAELARLAEASPALA